MEVTDPGAVPIYYTSARTDLLPLVPTEAWRVLDVGCGAGQLGQALKRRGSREVVGIELNRKASRVAATVLDQVICAAAETVSLDKLDPPYDCIIFADILEHLIDPWAALRRFATLLDRDGTIVASIPNVGFWSVVWGLLRGRWEYEERGLLDRAHLRFFTERSVSGLFEQAGLVVKRWERNYRLREHDKRGARAARIIARGPLKNLFTFQFLVAARGG
jgi:SAM-dependent methyltransferase